jgi:hypothetical protein
MFCSSYFRILVHLYGLTFLAVFQRTLLKSTYAMSAKTSPLPDPPSLPPSSLPPTLPLLSIKISLELQLNHDGANKNAIFMKVSCKLLAGQKKFHGASSGAGRVIIFWGRCSDSKRHRPCCDHFRSIIKSNRDWIIYPAVQRT